MGVPLPLTWGERLYLGNDQVQFYLMPTGNVRKPALNKQGQYQCHGHY